jgi:hypothetical protein
MLSPLVKRHMYSSWDKHGPWSVLVSMFSSNNLKTPEAYMLRTCKLHKTYKLALLLFLIMVYTHSYYFKTTEWNDVACNLVTRCLYILHHVLSNYGKWVQWNATMFRLGNYIISSSVIVTWVYSNLTRLVKRLIGHSLHHLCTIANKKTCVFCTGFVALMATCMKCSLFVAYDFYVCYILARLQLCDTVGDICVCRTLCMVYKCNTVCDSDVGDTLGLWFCTICDHCLNHTTYVVYLGQSVPYFFIFFLFFFFFGL